MTTISRWMCALCLCWVAMAVRGQVDGAMGMEPVQFRTTWQEMDNDEALVVFEAEIAPGWHVYGCNISQGGPTVATFTAEALEGVELVDSLYAEGPSKTRFDELFGMEVTYHEQKVRFCQKVHVTAENPYLKGFLQYGACNDVECLPPTQVDFVHGQPAQTATEPDVRATVPETSGSGWWLHVFLAGLLGGFLALFTPCVWPIIPMTVSFFLKRSDNKRRAVGDAVLYGTCIVWIYLALGLLVTWLFGASALNALSTNAFFNLFFFLLLVVFAASFLGAFELTLPSSWSNAMDSRANKTTGVLSIFFMAFTLVLVSFSCTGPIIGFLLVDVSTSGSFWAPAVGMFGFALALALPFTLFAMFPSWMKSMPKSGGWMNVLKVTLAFVELAFALKFLSVADLAYGWHLLDRETFLALWIVIFGLLGFYLLGKLKFRHDDDDTHIGVTRFFLALLSLAFAVYLVPGLWGAPLKAVSAFAPPMETQDFNLYDKEVRAQFTDYDEGLAYARKVGKPALIDFTGYGCVNCRKMELAVWTNDNVRSLLNDNYVLITLHVDDKSPLPTPLTVEENGRTRTLRTVGDKWSYLQRSKFGANTQPFYVPIDGTERVLNTPCSFCEDVAQYVDFLKGGLKAAGKK